MLANGSRRQGSSIPAIWLFTEPEKSRAVGWREDGIETICRESVVQHVRGRPERLVYASRHSEVRDSDSRPRYGAIERLRFRGDGNTAGSGERDQTVPQLPISGSITYREYGPPPRREKRRWIRWRSRRRRWPLGWRAPAGRRRWRRRPPAFLVRARLRLSLKFTSAKCSGKSPFQGLGVPSPEVWNLKRLSAGVQSRCRRAPGHVHVWLGSEVCRAPLKPAIELTEKKAACYKHGSRLEAGVREPVLGSLGRADQDE